MVNEYIEEFMEGNPRHSTVMRLRTGVKDDGTITAHEAEAFVNTGAYAGYKPMGIIGGAVRSAMAGPYRMPAVRLASTEVYTNTVPCGHMRSPGEPQGAFAIESHMDEIARRLGMDPYDLRLKNVIVDGDETPMGAVHHDLRGTECLEAAAETAGYHDARPRHVGKGVAMCDRAPVGGVGTLAVTLQQDGTIALGTPVFDQGTGTYATHRQVIAEEFGVDPARISFQPWPTGAVNYDSGIGGMRATRVNTITAYEAAQDTKRNLFALASQHLEWPADELTYENGQVRWAGHDEAIGWQDLLAQADTTVSGRGEVNEQGRTHVTCFAVQIAEVEVDPETGEVKLLSFTTAHDTGQIINPLGHQGQINGGFVQGIGYGMMEELLVEDGRVTTLSFGDYKIPTMADLPEGVGPYNIKGIGETPNTPTAAAIANAVEDACGVRIRDLPVTAEKVYRALRGASA
jgi:carbon-monoxide dehydrogenase large subunit